MGMTKSEAAGVEARRQAKELWTQKQDAERNEARARLRQAEDTKTARLKALRLAKEAADRIAGATIDPSQSRNPRQSRRRRAAS